MAAKKRRATEADLADETAAPAASAVERMVPADDPVPETARPDGEATLEKLITTRELMDFLNLSRTKVWELVTREDLPAFKIGGDYRYLRSEVLAWLEKYRVRKKD